MIEKANIPWASPISLKGLAGSLSGNSKGSPFLELLQQERTPSKVIDQILLNYLLKTIQEVMLRHNRGETFPPLPSWSPPAAAEVSAAPTPEKFSQPANTIPTSAAPVTQKIDDIIRSAADQYDLDPALIKAVITVESNGNHKAVSPSGAQGLMQLMPKTAAELGVTDPFDAAQNVRAGSRYLKQLLDRYKGNLQLALAAYNWGMGHLERNPNNLPKETRNYIVRVEKQYQKFSNNPSTA
jgi:soluble lytic murein transglycosylase-like protein